HGSRDPRGPVSPPAHPNGPCAVGRVTLHEDWTMRRRPSLDARMEDDRRGATSPRRAGHHRLRLRPVDVRLPWAPRATARRASPARVLWMRAGGLRMRTGGLRMRARGSWIRTRGMWARAPEPVAEADRRRLAEEQARDLVETVGRDDRGDVDAGSGLLHDDGREVDLERAGGESSLEEEAVVLRVHVVDGRLDDDDVACGAGK